MKTFLIHIYKHHEKSVKYYYRIITVKEDKMKKIKFMIPAFAISAITFLNGFNVYGSEYCDSITYIVSEKEVVITGYTGNPVIINLPSQIDGLPVTEIRENAFYKCGTIKEVIIPKSVSVIGRYAFYDCTSLENIEINGSADQIPEGIFCGCEKLENVSLNISPSTIGDYAFFGCRSLKEFKLPSSVTDIGSYSFAECSELSEISIGRKLKNIEEYSFYDCEALEKINLPESLLSIGQHAIGFSENGISDNITITGISDSIAEHYAKNSGIKFQSRIRYKSDSVINGSAISKFFTWFSFAIVYILLMIALISGAKRRKPDF